MTHHDTTETKIATYAIKETFVKKTLPKTGMWLKIGNDTVLKLWLIAGVWPAPKITRVRKTAKDGAIKFNTVPETT